MITFFPHSFTLLSQCLYDRERAVRTGITVLGSWWHTATVFLKKFYHVSVRKTSKQGCSKWITCLSLNSILNFFCRNMIFADTFRLSLFTGWRCTYNLGKNSGCFIIISWPISEIVYNDVTLQTSFYNTKRSTFTTSFCKTVVWLKL